MIQGHREATPRQALVVWRSHRRPGALWGLALLLASSLAMAQTDGPYVLRNASGALEAWSVQGTPEAPLRKTQAVEVGATITIPAVGRVPAFDVKLRAPASTAPETVVTRANTDLFVVADTHGEYEILLAMLQKQRIVDPRLRWSFGRGHLVILGDVFDRGPNHTEILWLLYALEPQARRAGGAVHLLLGNHETMVLRGDLRYLNGKYSRTAALLGVNSYAQLFDAASVLGQWLRTLPAALKINGLLCVHGGISPALVEQRISLTDINAGVRAALADAAPGTQAAAGRAEFLMGREGPLWYRGYFAEHADFPTATGEDVDRALQWFGVSHILVGHTIVPTITELYGDKVIAVQVYPRRETSGAVTFESLLIRGGMLWRANLQGIERLSP